MCKNLIVEKTPLGGISLCNLDELYTADRDLVAKLIGYLAMTNAFNLMSETLDVVAQVDNVEALVNCRALFECAYMDLPQKAASLPTYEGLGRLYQSARAAGLYSSVPLMVEVYRASHDVPGYTAQDNQYVVALGEMLSDLMALCKALEARLSDLQAAWATVERMVAHSEDLVRASNCHQFLVELDMVAAQNRACNHNCQDDCQGSCQYGRQGESFNARSRELAAA